MTQRFLNFVDVATDFGKRHFRSVTLLAMFGAANNLTEQQISTLRNQLEAKGIL